MVDRWRKGAQIVWAVAARAAGRADACGLCRDLLLDHAARRRAARDAGARRGLLPDRPHVSSTRSAGSPSATSACSAHLTWLGFRQEHVEYDKQPRAAGRVGLDACAQGRARHRLGDGVLERPDALVCVCRGRLAASSGWSLAIAGCRYCLPELGGGILLLCWQRSSACPACSWSRWRLSVSTSGARWMRRGAARVCDRGVHVRRCGHGVVWTLNGRIAQRHNQAAQCNNDFLPRTDDPHDRLYRRVSPEPVDMRNRQVQRDPGQAARRARWSGIGLAVTSAATRVRCCRSRCRSSRRADAADAGRRGSQAQRGRFELFLHAFDGPPSSTGCSRPRRASIAATASSSTSSRLPRPDIVRSCSARGRSSIRSGSRRPSSRCSPSAWRTRSGCRSIGVCATCSTPRARAIRCTCRRRCTRTPASTARSWSASRSCSRSSTARSTSWATCPTRRSSTT